MLFGQFGLELFRAGNVLSVLCFGSHLQTLLTTITVFDRQLVRGAGQRLLGQVQAHALDFIEHAAGFDWPDAPPTGALPEP